MKSPENPNLAVAQAVTVPYSAAPVADCERGTYFRIVVTDGVAIVVGAPLNPPSSVSGSVPITYEFLNSSGGVQGATTFDAIFRIAGAFTVPASTKYRTISFAWNGTKWVELCRVAADIT